MMVADVGAMRGFFTRRLANTGGETGQMLSVDTKPKLLDYHKQELDKLGMAYRVSFILAKIVNMEQTGYTSSKEHTFLQRQYFLEFKGS